MKKYYLRVNGNIIDIKKSFIGESANIPHIGEYDRLNHLDELENLLLFIGMFNSKTDFILKTRKILGIDKIDTMEIVDENNKVLLTNMIFLKDIQLLDIDSLSEFMSIYGGVPYTFNGETNTMYNWLIEALFVRIENMYHISNQDKKELKKEFEDINKIIYIFIKEYLPNNTTSIEEKIKVLKTYKRIIQAKNIKYTFKKSSDYIEKINMMKRLFNEYKKLIFIGKDLNITQAEYENKKRREEFQNKIDELYRNDVKQLSSKKTVSTEQINQDEDDDKYDLTIGHNMHKKRKKIC